MTAVKPRILIIDPDTPTVQFLEQELKRAGYDVYTATQGKVGLITAYRERPHIIIIDPVLQDYSTAELMQKLRTDPRTAQRKFIAFSSLQNPADVQKSLEMGFDHYISKAADALPNLLSKVQEVIAETSAGLGVDSQAGKAQSTRRATQPRVEEKDGKTIVALSAKGGAGTSSICANVAAAISQRSPESTVVVVDMVLPLGSIASIVGYKDALDIVEVSQKSSNESSVLFFQQNLPEIKEWGFRLLAGASNPDQSAELDVKRIPVIIDTLKRSFDYVLVDLGRSLSRISLPIILSADQILMVMGMDSATADLTEKIWTHFRSQGVVKRQVYPLINRSVGHEGMSKSELETLLDIDITNAIPFTNANFSLANNHHLPYMTKFPDDSATLAMIQAADEIKNRLENSIGSLAGFQ